jgi:serine/threonine-protein kinase
VGIALELCDAVGAAHDLGIVHRDLKPENVMLVRRGDDSDFVKLLDFGLSRFGEAEAGVSTHAGAVLGTARYLSPEGARGEPVGPAADVYAVATLLFECLAGRTPFDGDRPVAILVKKSSERAPDLADLEHGRSVPAPVRELIARALEVDPAARPADARTLGQALADAARASGLGEQELWARPTLLGTRAARRLTATAPTRVLGSPAVVAPRIPDAPRDAGVPPGSVTTGSPLPALGRFGIILACFTLGVLGALAIATHVGGCGGAWH